MKRSAPASQEGGRPIVVWFRRDLRVDDNPALIEAVQSGATVLPLFVVDTKLISTLPSDGAAFDLQAGALRELEDTIRRLGGHLLLRHGDGEDVHRSIIREFHPSALYFNRDYEPSARARDERVSRLYRSAGIEVRSFRDVVVFEPDEVLTADGRPYSVFTPFANAWKRLPLPVVRPAPKHLRTPVLSGEAVPNARSLGRPTTISAPIAAGGSSAARARWKWFLQKGLAGYERTRDLPAIDGTSRISPYLRFGMISIRRMVGEVKEVIDAGDAALATSGRKYLDELIWREFYQAVLYHFPRVTTGNFRPQFDTMHWRTNTRDLEAWKQGRTGVPLVDAGMRQLNETGWMHNRVRMVVASFLTKDLLIDWRRGEEYFASKLLDGDTAANNGGWQWAASTGVDPKPLRIFNPRLQAERYDPEGIYIRRYVPELRDVPQKYIHAPQEMPESLQRDLGCVIGRHYPAPIVDHASAAALYKKLFTSVKHP